MLQLYILLFAFVSIFSKIQLNKNIVKIVKCFLTAAFGVYLIHVHPVIWNYIMDNRFARIAGSAFWMLSIEVIGSALVIFVICLFVEKIRLILFKIIKLDDLLIRYYLFLLKS